MPQTETSSTDRQTELAALLARIALGDRVAFERLYRAFVAARAALGAALVAALGIGGLFGLRPTFAVIAISLAYATLAIGLWILPEPWKTQN